MQCLEIFFPAGNKINFRWNTKETVSLEPFLNSQYLRRAFSYGPLPKKTLKTLNK
jgi:hypothetical protein